MQLAILILTALLGSEVWSVREAATAALRDLGPLARPQLLLAAVSPDPEVRRRAADVLTEIRRREVDAWLAAQGPLPWVDSWTSYVPVEYYRSLGAAEVQRRGLPLGAPEWHEYRTGTRYYLADRLLGADVFDDPLPPLTFAEAGERLKVMRARCAAWTQGAGYPPIAMPEP